MNKIVAVLAFLASAWAIAFPAFAQQVADQPSAPAVMASAPTTSAGAPADGAKMIPLGTYEVEFPSAVRPGRMSYYKMEVTGDGIFVTGMEGAYDPCKTPLPSRIVSSGSSIAIHVEPKEEKLARNCGRTWVVRPAGGTFEGKVPSGTLTIKKL